LIHYLEKRTKNRGIHFPKIKMYDKDTPLIDNPILLQEACIDYICDNIESICRSTVSPKDGETKLQFKEEEVFFHTELSENLLLQLCEKKKMDDMVLTLFDSETTRLRYVRLKDASKLSTKGLKTLKGHKIVELEALGLTRATVTDLISCLGEWSLQNLRLLNVANSTFVDANKYCVVVALSKLKHLQTLNVSNTEFNKTSLELVVEDLGLLENLDISLTKVNDITPLRKCKERLKSLNLYGLKLPGSSSDTVVSVLAELKELVHLDISDEKEEHPLEILAPGTKFRIRPLLQRFDSLPKLISFDISGKEEILIHELSEFLSHHSYLLFLGLVLTDACKDDVFTEATHEQFRPNLVVSGFASEGQILEALKRYVTRPQYVQKTLYHLFRMTTGTNEPRIDMNVPRSDVIMNVLTCANKYPSVFGIQMAATACLFNLSKAELGSKIHPKILRDIVKTDLDAMENFPQHQQLQKNVLLTICSDRILQDVSFDKYRCAKLVLECLCTWQDHSMNRMSVAICSILAAKISTEETSELGSQSNYMKKLLSIVRGRMQEALMDITMKFTLSALWNLTDESPRTCQVFLQEDGMDLFLEVLQTFPNEAAIETKILGLLNNIAEVSWLRSSLMVDSFINILRSLLHSDSIDVSYFAAGIVAHLASDKPEAWIVASVTKPMMTNDLWNVVADWVYPKDEMVAYRSFRPFFPLLAVRQEEAVQLWAVWAIHHVCTKNPSRYCLMLQQQGGETVLLDLVREAETHREVANIADQVLQTMVLQGLLSQDEFLKDRQIFTSF